jgi:putative sigma-54 modulation protein
VKITYTGKPEALTPAEQRKVDAKLGKIAKLLDKPDAEREARIIYNSERHIHHAEIRVHYADQDLFGAGAAADTFTALSEAVEKLEKQVLKVRTKWRDTKRTPKQEPEAAPAAEAPARTREPKRESPESELTPEPPEGPQVFRIDRHERQKPMTLDEAMLEIDGRHYVVYRDAETSRTSVLIRRDDGNFDLIEA